MDLIPWQRAKQWHDTHGGDLPFEALLGDFFRSGYVWSSPTEFVLARPALWEEGELYMGAPAANCWFVHLAAGDNPFRRFLEIAPHPLPFVAWQRRGQRRYHVYEWDTFKRKLGD